MSTMPTLPELPLHKNIVDVLAVTFVFAQEIMFLELQGNCKHVNDANSARASTTQEHR